MVKQKRTIYIYKIYFPTSKRSYIGQSINPDRRLKGHLRGDHLVGRALRKYNNWQVSILHKTKSQARANKLEIAAITAHNSVAPGGYNIAAGGSNGNNFAGRTEKEMQITKKKMRKARKKQKPPTLGHHHTEETKKKIGAAHNGMKVSKEAIIKQILSRMGLPYTNKAAKETLQQRLEIWQNRKAMCHGKDLQKIRIKNIKKCLRWLAAGGTIE